MPKPRTQKHDRAAVRAYKATFETRQDKEKGEYIIRGLAAVYGAETVIYTCNGETFLEEIQRGAFNDKTDLTDVRLFVNHQLGALARSRNNNESSTMRLWIDDDGLHFEARLDVEHSPAAANLYSAVERGDMDACSFGFYVDKDGEIIEGKNGTRKRTVTQIASVIELSVVDFPAYPETSASASTKLQSRAQECDLDIFAELESSNTELESEDKNGEQAAEIERLRNQNFINLWR